MLNTPLQNKRIVLGVTGGIAAYKSASVIRLLQKAGAEVRVVMTANAEKFIGKLTMQALSGHPVSTDVCDYEQENAMGHIELARWCDLIVIAPATADCVSRLQHGAADDLITCICVATEAPTLVCPAMNQQMWADPRVQKNIEDLSALTPANSNIEVMPPETGWQACREVGSGRMPEPEAIVEKCISLFATGVLAQRSVLITSGPTVEPIDPVRFLSNHSSGRMGQALAIAAQEAGAQVTVVSGPTKLADVHGVKTVRVQTAQEMHTEVMNRAAAHDIVIGCAAVSDFRPIAIAEQKLKKTQLDLKPGQDQGQGQGQSLTLELIANPDIIKDVAHITDGPLTIAFCAETENLEANALAKIKSKGVSMIAANLVSDNTIGFNSTDNELSVYAADGNKWHIGKNSKYQVGKALIAIIAEQHQTINMQGTECTN